MISMLASVGSAQLAGEGSSRRGCLRDLRVLGSTPTSLTLGWDFRCESEPGGLKFKIYYEHLEWHACPTGIQDEQRGSGRGNSETSETVIVLDRLHPFSAYKLTVKALQRSSELTGTGRSPRRPEELEMVGETLPGMPGVAPEPSSIPTKLGQTELKFYWQHPSAASGCRDFNGEILETFFILKGTDSWNGAQIRKGTTTENSQLFPDLDPFSSYSLFLYAKSSFRVHNPEVYLKIDAQTMPSAPHAPRDLSEQEDYYSKGAENRFLRWLPPYPPTGELDFYRLRWKESNHSSWLDKTDVYPDSGDLCQSTSPVSPLERPVCHAVQDLDPERNYTFSISAYNKGIPQGSPWTPVLISEPRSGAGLVLDRNTLLIILIGSIVGVIFLILIGIFVSYVCCFKRRRRNSSGKKYKNVPPFDRNLSTNDSMMTGLTTLNSRRGAGQAPDSSLRRYHQHFLPIEERDSRPGSIQEQPLPPVPKEEHLYEELKLKKDMNREGLELNLEHEQPWPPKTSVVRKFSAPNTGDQTDEEEFLKPTAGGSPEKPESQNNVLTKNLAAGNSNESLEEGDYLPPIQARKGSADTLDMEDYLKPTFNQFQRINSRDLSPPTEAPPPIPTVSYLPPPQAKKQQQKTTI